MNEKTQIESSDTHRRIAFLDEWRGLCVILMVVYHLLFQMTMFGVEIPIYSPWLSTMQFFICSGFIFISGISSRFSKNNSKRGLTVFAAGLLITVVTYFFMPKLNIVFGILHCLGACMVLHGLFDLLPDKHLPFFWMIICAMLFALSWSVTDGYLGIFDIPLYTLPSELYKTGFLFPLGFMNAGFSSFDYFPLLPWMFLFFFGSNLGIVILRHKLPEFFYKKHLAFFGVIGRKALIIYILHAPIIYGVLYLIYK